MVCYPLMAAEWESMPLPERVKVCAPWENLDCHESWSAVAFSGS